MHYFGRFFRLAEASTKWARSISHARQDGCKKIGFPVKIDGLWPLLTALVNHHQQLNVSFTIHLKQIRFKILNLHSKLCIQHHRQQSHKHKHNLHLVKTNKYASIKTKCKVLQQKILKSTLLWISSSGDSWFSQFCDKNVIPSFLWNLDNKASQSHETCIIFITEELYHKILKVRLKAQNSSFKEIFKFLRGLSLRRVCFQGTMELILITKLVMFTTTGNTKAMFMQEEFLNRQDLIQKLDQLGLFFTCSFATLNRSDFWTSEKGRCNLYFNLESFRSKMEPVLSL